MSAIRKYAASLKFENWDYYDYVKTNEWTAYGLNSAYREALRFTEDSPFNDICDLKRNHMLVFDHGGYLHNKKPMYVGDNVFSIVCWIKFEYATIASYASPATRIPFIKWIDSEDKITELFLLSHNPDDLDTQYIHFITPVESNYIVYPSYQDYGKWFHFMYTREDDTHRIFINGHEIWNKIIPNVSTFTLKEFFLGAYYEPSLMTLGLEYAIEDFNIMNDKIRGINFTRPERPLRWFYPEVADIKAIIAGFDFDHYKYGTSTGLKYVYFYPTTGIGNKLTFNTDGYNSGCMLFMNSTFMAPDRYSKTVSGNTTTITLLNSTDIAIMPQSYFTLVGIEQTKLEFSWVVAQVTATANQTVFTIPSSINPIRDETVIAFNSTLAVVQPDRYYISGNKMIMNNPDDAPCEAGSPMTFVALKRLSYTGPATDLLVNRQIEFHKFALPVIRPGVAQMDILRADFASYGRIGVSVESMLLFVNGSYIPNSSITISENGEIAVALKNDDNLAYTDEVEAVIICSTYYKDYEQSDLKEVNPFRPNEFDSLIGMLRITRKDNYKEPHTAEFDMYEKILWYDHNKIPASNFNYINKFHIEWKE